MQQDNYSNFAEGTNPSSPSSNISNLPLRAVFLDSGGIMRELWLPAVKEGKYTFEGVEDLVAIVAEGNQWIAVCGGDGFFQASGGSRPNRVALQDKGLVKAAIGNRVFSIYAEADYGNSSVFLPYTVERYSEITIGRSPSCDLYSASPYISRPHASIFWDGKDWRITDLGSTNGTFINGKKVVQPTMVGIGDVIYIMGIYIVIGAGYVSINNADDRVTLMTPRVRPIQQSSDIMFSKATGYTEKSFFDRRPRKKYKLSVDPIEIDMPPTPMSGSKIPLALRLGSSAVMGGRSILTGNYVSALTTMVFPTLTQGYSEKDRKEYEEKRVARYREYLQEKEAEIIREIEYEEQFFNELFPNLTQMLRFSEDQDRLWERRRIDEDFLTVRIGRGNRPMVAEKQYSPKRFEMEPDFLLDEMYQLAEKPSVLRDVPITISLRDDWTVGITGDHAKALQLVRNLIMALAVTHAYDEVKIALFVDSQDAGAFAFAKYLRHFWDNDRNNRFFAANPADAQTVAKYLGDRWHSMMEEGGNRDIKAALKKQPAYVAFILSKELYDRAEFFKELLSQENYTGISLVAAFENAPKECSKLINLRDKDTLIDLVNPDNDDQSFALDAASQEIMDISMRQLMQERLRLDSQSFSLPSMITFLEMYGVGKVEHLNPMVRWKENNPVSSLAVPIGVGTDGKLFTLDLHEKRQGPHGLVAGMTGSGKSEFIITYILSMAVNFSPDEVAFILIDYKGGGLADAFVDPKRGIHLPHVVATITNLDGAAINRSLVSIHSELKRRQAVFKQAKSDTNEGTMDIYDYQKLYRNKRVKEPMPHLFIISDEFAELKKQQPEFMDELISTARIGRSLGVHLILATQKPGGVVNDQIWSNTKFRACLRVQDRSDSMEMLKRPEAAELRNTGRFYLQVGYNEYFALGQSAWCGAEYVPQDEVIVETDNSAQFIDNVGQTLLVTKPKISRQSSGKKQIVTVVQYLSDLAKRENIVPRSLWKKPLPPVIELSDLLQSAHHPDGDGIYSLIGMLDDPERQDQFPFFLDLMSFHNMMLIGNGGSGKSTFIRTLLYSAMERYSPQDLNYYIVDLSDKKLRSYSSAPHCGAYLTEENEDDVPRLLKFVRAEVERRKRLFEEANVFSFEAYRKLHPIPLLLVIFDNYMNVPSLSTGEVVFAELQKYLREGASFGVRFILTSNHTNEISAKAKQEIDLRIALQASDRYSYGEILDTKSPLTPAERNGSGLCVVDGRVLEYHTAQLDSALTEQDRASALTNRLKGMAERYGRDKTALRMTMVDFEQSFESFCSGFDKGRIPLGFAPAQMKAVAMPLRQLKSASVYFGNPKGVQVILKNLLYAMEFNNMRTVIVRRSSGSLFDTSSASYGSGIVKLFESNAEDVAGLSELILQEITAQNIFRDEYCSANGIPPTANGRSVKASKYIRSKTTPLVVLFERYVDFCAAAEDDSQKEYYKAFLDRMAGYNIFFIGCFYPEDESSFGRHELMKCFNREEFLLLFGGRYNKTLFNNMPYNVTKMELMNPDYNQFILKYQSAFYSIVMPCGKLEEQMEDPDEASII